MTLSTRGSGAAALAFSRCSEVESLGEEGRVSHRLHATRRLFEKPGATRLFYASAQMLVAQLKSQPDEDGLVVIDYSACTPEQQSQIRDTIRGYPGGTDARIHFI